MVKLFHQSFNHPIADKPTFMPIERANMRYKWMLEEINEFLEANDICCQVDAIIDNIYFSLGTLVEIGISPDKIFKIVQDANMKKLFPDGKPHYSPEGKVIKPDNWKPPEPKIKKVIDKLMRGV